MGDVLRQLLLTADHGASKEPLNFSTTSQVEKTYGPAVAADLRFVAAGVRGSAWSQMWGALVEEQPAQAIAMIRDFLGAN